jgi:hypothetical protein
MPNPIAFEGIPEVTTFLHSLEHPLNKADTIYEARVLAEAIPVPPLAEKVLNEAIARLRQYQIN